MGAMLISRSHYLSVPDGHVILKVSGSRNHPGAFIICFASGMVISYSFYWREPVVVKSAAFLIFSLSVAVRQGFTEEIKSAGRPVRYFSYRVVLLTAILFTCFLT